MDGDGCAAAGSGSPRDQSDQGAGSSARDDGSLPSTLLHIAESLVSAASLADGSPHLDLVPRAAAPRSGDARAEGELPHLASPRPATGSALSPECSSSGDVQRALEQHPKFAAFCKRTGMRPKAVAGWAAFHVSPAQAFCVAWSCTVVFTGGIVLTQFSRPQKWVSLWHIPTVAFAGGKLVLSALLWRHGPIASTLPIHQLVFVLFEVIGSGFLLAPMFFMNEASIPFENRLACVLSAAVVVGSCQLGVVSGLSYNDRPPSPHTSWLPVLARASLHTLKVMDAFTDGTSVRLLYDKVCTPHPSMYMPAVVL